MLNFAKQIQWPDHASTSNFVIGVYEYPPLVSELSAFTSSTKVGMKKIEIREVGASEEVGDCHILFVPAYKTKRFNEILTVARNKSMLLVCNKVGYANKGAGINFVIVDGKLRYEINSKAIEDRGLKVSSNLKALGIAVK